MWPTLHDVDHVDVLIVGAGLSGVGAAAQLTREHPGKSYAVLEKRAASGGTWDLFRYPGVRSDSDMYTLGYRFKPVFGARQPLLSTLLYVGMGWLVVIAARPLIQHVPFGGLMWLLAGGLAYTFGAVFFMFDHRIRYGHFVWHLFVLAGTACHFVAVFRYATGGVR